MTKTSAGIYHFLVLSWYIFLSYYTQEQIKNNEKLKTVLRCGRWRYLMLFNLVAFLDDVLRIKGRKDIKIIAAFGDLLFTVLAFPVTTFVFLTFWTMFLYDLDLIYPLPLHEIFPGWLNHAMHTLTLPLSLGEVILRPHRYPSKKTGLTLVFVAVIVYFIRILWFYLKMGVWVYPVFAKLSPVGLAATFSLGYVVIASIYLLGEKLNRWKWGDGRQLREKRK
ncbi:androgen-dependent TFPI-regulating protein [Cynocephalus volans]|uniref:androgen-dependent TFPI-regulating protein n=1 Tax=Cynocephalus volans TaxID=110931 RepID=UPI002FC894B7